MICVRSRSGKASPLIRITENTLRTILFFLVIYAVSIGSWLSTRRNYRRGEEHGSAKWGDPKTLNKRYADRIPENNKLLTRNVRIGLNGNEQQTHKYVSELLGKETIDTNTYVKHPSVRLTTDGKVELYIHGEPRDAEPSIELVYDPELVEAATEKVQVIELPDSDYVLLSEENVEKEVKQEVVSLG